MNLFDPTQWAVISGWFQLIGVSVGTLVLVGVKLAAGHHEDWLETRVGSDDGIPFDQRWRRRI